MTSKISVKKHSGKIEELNLDKIHKVVNLACEGLDSVSPSQVEINSNLQFYDGITTSDIQRILIRSSSDLISLDTPNYQYVASRLLLMSLRKNALNWRRNEPAPLIKDHIVNCVNLGIYEDYVLKMYDDEELEYVDKKIINHTRDYNFVYSALRQVIDKYLLQNHKTKKIYETPQYMYMMIALTLFGNYPKKNRMKYVKDYYDAISKHKINLPTPILSGVRTNKRYYASCILVDVDDTLDSIFASDSVMGYYTAARSGLGINVGRIRGINSDIRGGEVQHTGIIPFLKKFESTVNCCRQGATRGGGGTVHIPIWHQEIEDIIVLKNNKGTESNRVRKLDYSVQISKLFYERLIKDKYITLFSPHEVPDLLDDFYGQHTEQFDSLYEYYEKSAVKLGIYHKKIKARELFVEIMKERAETGRIYIMNIDHCNTHSSFKDKVSMSNLCVAGDTEIDIRYVDPKDKKIIEKKIKIKNLQYYLDKYSEVYIKSYDIKNDEIVRRKITNFGLTHKKAEVIKVTNKITGKDIILTPDHKVYTRNRGYVEAKDLTEDDLLIYDYI